MTTEEGGGNNNRDGPAGILRLDFGKSTPRRLSAEFKFLRQVEPTSPQPSVDRLSVTFAEDSLKSDSSKCNFYPPVAKMDKVHFPRDQKPDVGEESDEEDYSASVNAIIQRRASTRRSRRRNSRRASSPFSPDILPAGNDNDRRRSSVFTTSSGEVLHRLSQSRLQPALHHKEKSANDWRELRRNTAITMDENLSPEVTQEEIFENIKLHQEVLSNVKMQPWNMRKKLKLVVQAKAYIKKHEGALQERLAQSRSTKDMVARWNIYLIKKWQKWRREMANFSMWFIPWELKIKEIESHFGSVVASYFIFLRWLFWVNIVIAAVLVSFVAIPEMLTADPKAAGDRKFILPEEKYNATNFLTLWDFEGVFKYSPLFYGWYTNRDSSIRGYRLPFAYFVTGLVVYAYSFFATLRKMAENSRMSKLSEKDDECTFSWKVFTGWDYMIGNAETAHNRVASIVMGFKEALLEEAEKKREARNWRVICFRVLVNTVVLCLLSFSAFAVIMVVKRSTEPEANSTVWRKNEITVVMSLITLFFPMLFELLGFLEQYHPRKQLRLQLARIMVLNLLNLYSLIFALFDKITDMTKEFQNLTNSTPLPLLAVPTQDLTSLEQLIQPTTCYQICSRRDEISFEIASAIGSLVALSYPKLAEIIGEFNGTENFTEGFYNNFTTTENGFGVGNTTSLGDDYLLALLANFSYTEEVESSTGNYSEEDFFGSTTLDGYINSSTTEENFEREKTSTEITPWYEDYSSSTTPLETPTNDYYNCSEICHPATSPPPPEKTLDYRAKAKLRSLCWETMFGQELIKLTIMDLIMTVLSTLAIDFVRGIFVRFMNRCWCWDLEKKFPQYGDFKVAENILHLVNNQGMVWMGMFFSPGLVVLNVAKLYIMMYLRTWAVLTCNVPHEIIFRASRSNNFYYALLLMMLFLCVLPVGYAIVWIKPSSHCGPFSGEKIFHIFTNTIRNTVPAPMQKALDYIASPGIVIPLLVLLILIIYYLISLTGALKEANSDLKVQLRRERTEERRKMFQIADRRRRGGSGGSGDFSNAPFTKWKKILGNLPSGKSFDDTPKFESEDLPSPIKEEKVESKNKDFFSKFIKRALGKSSTSDDEQDTGTDTEQHESLPEDVVKPKIKPHKPVKSSISSTSSDFQMVITKALALKNQTKILEYDSSDSSARHVQIQEAAPMQFKTNLKRKDTFDLKKTASYQRRSHDKPSTSRQDSNSSVWSDNIPVIKISKTESAENILAEMKFKPKIKGALKKQSTEIDEETVCYFNKELQQNLADEDLIKSVARARLSDDVSENESKLDEDKSSSDTEVKEGSDATVLNSPYVVEVVSGSLDEDEILERTNGSTKTESSSDYKDANLS